MQSQSASSVEVPVDLYKVYVDTNVFHCLAIGPPPKNDDAKIALTQLSNAAQNDAIICVTSSIGLAEEYDVQKGRALIKREMDRGSIRWTPSGVSIRRNTAGPLDPKALTRAVNVVCKGLSNSIVRLENPTNLPIDLIDLLCRRSNLHWPDALHLAMALALRCDYIITNDEDFYQEMLERLTSTGGNLHRPVSQIIESVYGLTEERLQQPLIKPLFLRDPSTAIELFSLSSGLLVSTH